MQPVVDKGDLLCHHLYKLSIKQGQLQHGWLVTVTVNSMILFYNQLLWR